MRRPSGSRGAVAAGASAAAVIVVLVGSLLVRHGHNVGHDHNSSPAPKGAVAKSSVPLGFYVGAAKPNLLAPAARTTRTHPDLAEDFLPGGAGWAGMTKASQLRFLVKAWQGKGYRLVLGVPIIPTSGGSPVGTLAAGAAGDYNRYFRTLARDLVANGEGDTILRLGWEFNGNWEAWSVANATDAANFAGYFRQIAMTMRAISPDFQFDWNLSDGSAGPYNLAAAYPGNAYVDYVGVDVYDESCAIIPDPETAWRNFLTAPAGLNWAATFAAKHGKPISIPEWGVDSGANGSCGGLGDDPYFIGQMATWLTRHHAAFSIYFDFDAPDGSHRLQDGTFPNSLAAFQERF